GAQRVVVATAGRPPGDPDPAAGRRHRPSVAGASSRASALRVRRGFPGDRLGGRPSDRAGAGRGRGRVEGVRGGELLPVRPHAKSPDDRPGAAVARTPERSVTAPGRTTGPLRATWTGPGPRPPGSRRHPGCLPLVL